MDARRFIRRHDGSGYVVMSAERVSNTRAENKRATAELMARFRNKYNLQVIKAYGGYVMSSDGQRTQEVSLVVLPYNCKGEPVDLHKTIFTCMLMGDRYYQESILVRDDLCDVPYLWYCKDGSTDKLSKNVVYNDESQEYNTDFRKGTTGKLSDKKRATRFSLV